MPPSEHKGCPNDWLSFAKSDLALAKVDKTTSISYESLCFHTQQAVEKALKALLISDKIEFPRTHNVRILLDLLKIKHIIPDIVDESAVLTEYAVSSRYPGESEPIEEEEYKHSVKIAEKVLDWAEAIINNVA
jgi:HEPN domain-containing protein